MQHLGLVGAADVVGLAQSFQSQHLRAGQAWRMASTGSSREAREAGTAAAPTPATVASAMAAGISASGMGM